MEYVDFFGHKVSKLIVGDNPITGHSYIAYKITGADMMKYYTTENVLKLLFEIEASGINTMLPLSDPYILRILKEYKYAGGKMQFIFQPYMPVREDVRIRQMMELEPIGVYHQGTTTDKLFECGEYEEIKRGLKAYHEMGIPVGLGTHRPDVIEMSEREGWDVDFYMACMQNARIGREREDSGFLTGKPKNNITFHPDHRPVMLNTLKNVEKPIIVFKIFAGGQMLVDEPADKKREIIKGVYEEIFPQLKPNDFAAMGVFQRDEDQLKENVDIFNEWAAGK